MRLRQVVIAARDLETTVAHLTAVFGIEVSYRDPGVAEFGRDRYDKTHDRDALFRSLA